MSKVYCFESAKKARKLAKANMACSITYASKGRVWIHTNGQAFNFSPLEVRGIASYLKGYEEELTDLAEDAESQVELIDSSAG